jgi:uncharacterized protein
VPEPTVKKPTLVLVEEGASPKLRARRCACGHVFFPPQPYGCERCGQPASAQVEHLVDPRGVLTAVATVHAHTKRKVPYGIGRVTLDDGPSIDVCLVDGAALTVGQRVSGRLVAVADAGGVEALDCLFGSEERAS